MDTTATILERSNRKDPALSITPLDSIRRAIARRNGTSNPAASKDGAAKAQGGRIENGLFPASHTAEELARIQELSQRNAGGPDSAKPHVAGANAIGSPAPSAAWSTLGGTVCSGAVLRRRVLHAGSGIRGARHPPRLPLERSRHRRVGLGVSAAHHRVHTARGRRRSRQVLHRLCHRARSS